MTWKLSELASSLGAQLRGEDVSVSGVAFVESAGPGDIVFVESTKWLGPAEASAAAALIVPDGFRPKDKPHLVVERPRLAFLKVLSAFSEETPPAPGIHPTAVVPSSCVVDASATVAAHVVLGERCAVGPGAVIGPLVALGDDVEVGAGTVLHPNVSVYSRTKIGCRVVVHSGASIGSDGFGYETVDGHHLKVPHLGNVVLDDDVEIGANSTVDRAKTGSTFIGKGTKIDNLVQVAHNVRIGAHCLMAGCSAAAGSATMGDHVILAAEAGVGPHVKVGDGAMVLGRGGAISDVEAGAAVSGFPARDHRIQAKIQAVTSRLPELRKTVLELARRVAALEAEAGTGASPASDQAEA
ncbi:MAG TPA: UDP-3-O-(3-hydroxymyristoyl)glucosamine N-acyltransferase [Armatimonadota bacterium]|jgi:UDP-3-O-[3-hydroxymyristoyl] glucosamine N-acyltransferase